MKVYVFGKNGMLGRYLFKYINKSIGVTRSQIDAFHVRNNLMIERLAATGVRNGDVIINAMGVTNKRTANVDEFIIINSLFPRLLADYCEHNGIKLIHISTDCVYNGKTGEYVESFPHDDDNIYGISKSCGEPRNCTVIRTSIIGENPNSNKDLLEWVRKTRNGELQGWTNHLWNGITCLQFAKVCKDIIDNNRFWMGVRHVFSPEPITKADLVELIGNIYELNNTVNKVETHEKCDRTLQTIYNNAKFDIPSIKEQIIEQKEWSKKCL